MASTNTADSKELKDTGYEIFILLLSLVSILNMLVAVDLFFLTSDPLTLEVLVIIDSVLTVFFLFDFIYRITSATSKSGYFFGGMGWADLLACILSPHLPDLPVVRAWRLMKKVGLADDDQRGCQ
jgi:voltage-gated potassium channel